MPIPPTARWCALSTKRSFGGTFKGDRRSAQRIAVRAPTGLLQVRQIVGVARQVKGRPDETEEFVQLYVPLAQDPFDDIFLLVRPKAGPASALASSVRGAIARVDKEQLVTVGPLMTLDDIAIEGTARQRFRAWLVMTFAGLALMLALVGVFGIIAYSVQQRMREFGVRIALGASTGTVLGLVLRGAARMVGHRRRNRPRRCGASGAVDLGVPLRRAAA